MVDVNLNSFLRQGYWSSSRARSPDLRHYTSIAPSSPTSYLNVTPRKLPDIDRPPPPQPCVEDETVSLAKEFGSAIPIVPNEEPQHKGDPDQYPLLELVHEFNPERRFVIVQTPPPDTPGDSSDTDQKSPRSPKSMETRPEPELDPISYEANTTRKYDIGLRLEEESEKKQDAKQDREKHRNKLNLPTIITDIRPEPYLDTRRPKSTARAGKVGDDYFSPRFGSRFQDGNLLSPDVIEHSSRGRDRVYYQGGSGHHTSNRHRSTHSDVQFEKTPRDSREYAKSAKSASPTHHTRRSTADIPRQTRSSSKLDYDRSRQYVVEPRSPRSERNGYTRYERDTASQVSSNSAEKRRSPPGSEYYHSSDDDNMSHHSYAHHRRDSMISNGARPNLQTPTELRPSDMRRSRGPSPLPSPRISQLYERESVASSPRSATFPKEIRFSRYEQPSRPPLSRTSTGRSMLDSPTQMAFPTTPASPASTVNLLSPGDPRKSATFPTHRASSIQPEARSSASALSVSSHRLSQHSLEPIALSDLASSVHTIAPYGRYMDAVDGGEIPNMHSCPRRKPTTDYVGWFTLPHCDNLHICTTCFDDAFAGTEFAQEFVVAPFGAQDRAIVCDFGTSRYHHIAYYLTQKSRKADATLFRNIANVAAKSQPCCGPREVSRIWYSVKDPLSGHPVETFNVCYTCAKTIEALLPNLTGLFVPMDSPAEPKRGVCSMHQENERRFLMYFDLLEAASGKAIITDSTPDVLAIADRIRDLTSVPECARDRPVQDGKWYTMRSMPNFTVCEQCFGDVVWPMIQHDSSSMAANFHKNPQKLATAACHLYSDRMRDIFKYAVRHSDMRYLDSKLRERRDKEREYYARIVGLDKHVLGAEWVDVEIERARKEWQRWE
ncbi:hypothetical protein M426DRAFT_317712 [Hypoxylon sp. CI-4A]|nr:hypothetical protein M426DRAFT_317712 [Hypoxylon sp. CI-4A]